MIDDLLRQFRESLGEEFMVNIEAARFVDYVTQNHPAEFDTWLRERSQIVVAQILREILHRERSRSRFGKAAREFRDAADAYAEGTDEGRQVLATYFVTNKKNVWKRLSDCTSDDLAYIAEQYEHSASRSNMWAAFHRHLQRQIPPGKKVADVFTEEQLLDLQEKFTSGLTA